jgi:hypothetical protein
MLAWFVSHIGDIRNAQKSLVEKTEWNGPLGIRRCR